MKNVILYLIIGVLTLLLLRTWIKNRELTADNKYLNSRVTSKDSLILLSDGKYSVLNREFAKTEEALKIIGQNNMELANKLEALNSKLISYSQLAARPEPKKEIIEVPKYIYIDSGKTANIDFYYPDSSSSFITHSLSFKDKSIYSDWKFGTLNLGLTVFEDQNGKWNSIVDGPKWLTINSLKVNSIEKSQINKVPKFYFVGALQYRFNREFNSSDVGFNLGFEHSKNIFLGGYYPQTGHFSITYGYKFRLWK